MSAKFDAWWLITALLVLFFAFDRFFPKHNNVSDRFKLIQLGDMRRDQYLLDTATGRAWSPKADKDGFPETFVELPRMDVPEKLRPFVVDPVEQFKAKKKKEEAELNEYIDKLQGSKSK